MAVRSLSAGFNGVFWLVAINLFSPQVPTLLGEVDSFTAHRTVYDSEKKQNVRQDMKENVWIRTNQALSTLVRFYGITPEGE